VWYLAKCRRGRPAVLDGTVSLDGCLIVCTADRTGIDDTNCEALWAIEDCSIVQIQSPILKKYAEPPPGGVSWLVQEA
jgi:hypothetical protein